MSSDVGNANRMFMHKTLKNNIDLQLTSRLLAFSFILRDLNELNLRDNFFSQKLANIYWKPFPDFEVN